MINQKLKVLLATPTVQDKDKYLFVVDNDNIAAALMAATYKAISTEEVTPEDIIAALDTPTIGIQPDLTIVPCINKADNDAIIAYCKHNQIRFDRNGYRLFYKKDYLSKPEFASELVEAMEAYIREHEGSGTEELLITADNIYELTEAHEQYCNRNHIQEFINGIAASANTTCIPTGFEELDKQLDGGLYEGLYSVGAITSLGKTTFVQRIADNIAAAGNDVLYISMEMSRNELISKSISRHTYIAALESGLQANYAKTARGITAGARYANYSAEEKEIIQVATEAYSKYCGNIYTVEGMGDIGVKEIRKLTEEHIKLTDRRPVVVIDYLQILAPYNDRASDKQNADKNIMELKRLSRDLKLPVICISSVNRANYLTPIDLEAFKESGGIEYTSDVIIGLQFNALNDEIFNKDGNIKDKRALINQAKAEIPRKIEAVILKNRQGKTGDKVLFDYYPMYNEFEEEGSWQPASKGSGVFGR